MVLETVRTKLDTLPTSPGVYVFRDAKKRVLYVGKASNLRNRVRSYFQPGSSDVRAFVARLEKELDDIETFVTRTDKEAALLENQLIKADRPKYNIKLRDDKEYLSLRLDPASEWPRLEVVRRPKPDGAWYFGPYDSATAARQTLRLVNRYFQLRTCTNHDFRSRVRPCLQHQIKRCPAPCVLEVDRDDYATQVQNVARFLGGRHDELIDDLEARMGEESSKQHYERAAIFRDQLHAVERVRQEQRVASVKKRDQDVVGFFRQGDQAEVAVLRIRGGRLFGVQTLALRRVAVPDEEMLSNFLSEYYTDGSFVPNEILIQQPIELMEGLGELLGETRAHKVRIVAPQRGEKQQLIEMATENAEHAFAEKQRAREDLGARLTQIQERLRLERLPHLIECVDISHTGGQETVAVVVRLRDGAPLKEGYRSFRVKTVSGGDDYGAMYEVLTRRLRRGRDQESGWELPDLLVVDGGKGQLNVAERAVADVGGITLELASIAKEREAISGEVHSDRVFRPGWKDPVEVRKVPALSLLLLARDEAHRASNALRKKVGKKQRFSNELDQVPGVGPKTRSKLLTALGSLRAVEAADESALIKAGATKTQAEAIRRRFGQTTAIPTELDAVEEEALDNAFR